MAVHKETDGPVLTVTIDRRESRNAVDAATAEDLLSAFRDFDDDPDLSVAVLTGAGGTFCSGADLKELATGQSPPANRLAPDGPGPMGPTRLDLSKPVIAAVEGHAVAGGLELAVWCDLRVAADDAVFGIYCRRWGVPLVDGGTIRLTRLIGHSRATDLILTGRPVGGTEALQMGLANRLTEPGRALTEAQKLALELAELPQTCMRSDLRSMKDQWNLPIAEAILHETELGLTTIRSGETRSGAQRFSEGSGRHGRPA
ncbi:MAG: crotonase/enoyl-CoA hydratase family protein [Acidimicrobiales bacterium]|jgi:enoyl-CoA hydratase|nr:crotonase/enoyl-CoA hydratase family protein [Acidimicrobiales bacterium]|tara:strand:+ start:847 stop:1620 length:774 start_codon:yes stop_codon:yes gene_type:complete